MLQKTFRITRDATDEYYTNSFDIESVIRYLFNGRLRDHIKKLIRENKHILGQKIQKSFCKVDGKFVRNCSCKKPNRDEIINPGRSLASVALNENLTEKFRNTESWLEMIEFLKSLEVDFEAQCEASVNYKGTSHTTLEVGRFAPFQMFMDAVKTCQSDHYYWDQTQDVRAAIDRVLTITNNKNVAYSELEKVRIIDEFQRDQRDANENIGNQSVATNHVGQNDDDDDDIIFVMELSPEEARKTMKNRSSESSQSVSDPRIPIKMERATADTARNNDQSPAQVHIKKETDNVASQTEPMQVSSGATQTESNTVSKADASSQTVPEADQQFTQKLLDRIKLYLRAVEIEENEKFPDEVFMMVKKRQYGSKLKDSAIQEEWLWTKEQKCLRYAWDKATDIYRDNMRELKRQVAAREKFRIEQVERSKSQK